MKNKTIALLLIITIVIVASMLFLVKKPEKETPPASIENYVAAEGKVQVMDGYQAEIGSQLDGRISEFYVGEGDEVKKGDLIAKLDDRELRAKLREAEAELNVSKSKLNEIASGAREEEIKRANAVVESALADVDFARESLERYKLLYKEGFATKEQLDEKEKVFKVAGAKVKEAQEEKTLIEKGPKKETIKNLEDAVRKARATAEYYREILDKSSITAPISGKVIRKYLHKGEIISKEMNTPLVAIADLQKIWINAEIDETDFGKIKIGDPAEIKSDAYPDKVFKGEVHRISDYVGTRGFIPNNPAKNLDIKVIQVKILINDKEHFKPGMTVDVKIIPGKNK